MRDVTGLRRRIAALSLIGAGLCWAMPASAALPPQYPGGMDDCRVVAAGEPRIDHKPVPSGRPVAPGAGAGRTYTVPATLDCRSSSKLQGSFVCDPNFLAWAEHACRGLTIRK